MTLYEGERDYSSFVVVVDICGFRITRVVCLNYLSLRMLASEISAKTYDDVTHEKINFSLRNAIRSHRAVVHMHIRIHLLNFFLGHSALLPHSYSVSSNLYK